MTEKKLKLRPSVKKKWLEALRSGEYKQTQGELRSEDKPNSFCCLGVLCNIHAQEHPTFAKLQKKVDVYDGQTGVPSKRVLKWAFGSTYRDTLENDIEVLHPTEKTDEWDSDNQAYKKVPEPTTLVELNDTYELTFKQIAKVIEKQL